MKREANQPTEWISGAPQVRDLQRSLSEFATEGAGFHIRPPEHIKCPRSFPNRYARFSCNISQWRLSRRLRLQLQPGNPVQRECLFHLPRFENVSPEICCHIFRTLSDAIGHELPPWHAATSLNERGRSKLRTVKMFIDMMLFWRRADSLFNQCEFMFLVTVHL